MADTELNDLTAITTLGGDEIFYAVDDPTGAQLDRKVTFANVIGSIFPAWTAYTPSWTATSTNPSIGNGTLTGSYLIVGKTVHFRIELVGGSTTSWGTGLYSFGLPTGVTAAAASGQVVAGFCSDATGLRTPASGTVFAGGTTVARVATNNGNLSPSVPFTWTTSDVLGLSGCIEIA